MTQYHLKVITNAAVNKVEIVDENHIKIRITTTPEKGKANKDIIKLLSKYFKCSKSSITIIQGEFSSDKVIDVAE